jgi:hypothetical protein
VTPRRRRPAPGAPMTWVGLAVGFAGLAATLRPFQAPSALVWTTAGLGGLSLAAAGALALRRVIASPDEPRPIRPTAPLASACRRVEAAIAQLEEDKHHGTLAVSETQQCHNAARNYRDNYSRWALSVFDSAVAAGAVDDCSRSLVETPTSTQLHIVRELFRDAAIALEPAHRIAV